MYYNLPLQVKRFLCLTSNVKNANLNKHKMAIKNGEIRRIPNYLHNCSVVDGIAI